MTTKTLQIKIDPSGAQSGARVVKRSLDDINRGAASAERSTDRFGRQAKTSFSSAAKGATLLSGAIGKVGLALGGIISAAALIGFSQTAGKAFYDLDRALGETSTLIAGTAQEMAYLEDKARSMGKTFGTSAVSQVNSFYQAISAGAKSVEEAGRTLEVANKLAVGGVTDIQVATDGLTSILNAYGDKVQGATAVSDSFFVAMKAGKTTVGALASSLGVAAPIAAQVGVSFDELTASIAALTKGGISTNVAVTGVRAILAAVAKPTAEATKLAKGLGLEFNTAALKAKGFQKFIADIKEKTGGSTDQLAQLFGGVEALVPMMALAGQAGLDFNAIMAQMAEKTGATDEAFEKISQTASFRFNVEMQRLTDIMYSIGKAVLPTVVWALEKLNNGLDAVMGAASRFSQHTRAEFVLLADVAVAAFERIPAAVGEFTVNAINWMVEKINAGLNLVIQGANLMISGLNKIPGVAVDLIEEIDTRSGTLANKWAGAGEMAGKSFSDAFQKYNSTIANIGANPGRGNNPGGRLIAGNPAAAANDNSAGIPPSVTDSIRSATKAVNENKDAWSGLRAVNDNATIAMQESAQAQMDYAKSLTSGFISDLKSGLQQGESLWESFGNAAINVLNKVTDRILNQLLDAVFQVNNASGGGGNLFSMLLGGIGKSFSPVSISPGMYGGMPAVYGYGTNFHPGGMATINDRGPETVYLPRGTRVETAQQSASRSMAANQNGGNNVQVLIENYSGAPVREEKGQSGGVDFRRIIIGEVGKAIAGGELDKPFGGRFNAKPAVRNIG